MLKVSRTWSYPVYTGQIVLRQMINQNCAQGIAHNIDGGTEAIA